MSRLFGGSSPTKSCQIEQKPYPIPAAPMDWHKLFRDKLVRTSLLLYVYFNILVYYNIFIRFVFIR